MKITVYTMCYNEEMLLPFFLEHYSNFATEIIIYDNESTDRTVEIASKHPLVSDIKTISTDNVIDERNLTNFKNNCWKNSTSDYVIVVDVDEFLYHPNIVDFLNNNKKYAMFKPHGYNMVSTTTPDSNYSIISQIKTGVRYDFFDKQCIFSPKLVSNVNYDHGAHKCFPDYSSNIENGFHLWYNDNSDNNLKLLHYKYITLDYFVNKRQLCKDRLSDFNIKNRYCYEYTHDINTWKKDFNHTLETSQKVI
jgi:glycosyltransferase involved in cell wall biosynthesis